MPGIVLGSRDKNLNEKNIVSTSLEWQLAVERSSRPSDSAAQSSEASAVVAEILGIVRAPGEYMHFLGLLQQSMATGWLKQKKCIVS